MNYSKGIVLACAVLLLAVGCRTEPIRNLKDIQVKPLSGKELTIDQITKAIVLAGAGLNWQMDIAKPGHIVGKLALRGHVAYVDIAYDTKAYSITYKNSFELLYDQEDQTIHRNYNGWIYNLNNAIRGQLSAAGL